MSVYERRPDLINQLELPRGDERDLRSSVNSDMSIDNDDDQAQAQAQNEAQEQNKTSTWQLPKAFTTSTSLIRNNDTNSNVVITNNQKDDAKDNNKEETESSSPAPSPAPSPTQLPSSPTPAPSGRRLSVQDRINMFEKKQKENTGKPVELRRMSSDILRRWSGSSDMSIDVSMEKKPLSSTENKSITTTSIDNTNNNNNNHNDNNNIDSDKVVKTDEGSSQESCKVSVFDEERSGGGVGFKEQVGVSGTQLKGYEVTVDDNKDVDDDVKFHGGVKSNVVPTSVSRVQRSHSRSLSAQFEGGAGLKSKEPSTSTSHSSSVVLNGVSQSSQSTTQPQFEDLKNQVKEEHSQVMKTKYQKPLPSSSEQTSMSRSKRDEIRRANDNESTKLNHPGKKNVMESQDNARVTAVPLEQNQRVRQSKGNQEMHDELKLKADELEKLFAEHKLRVPGDQSGTARRVEPADARVEQAINLQSRRPSAGDSTPQSVSRSSVPEPATSSGVKSLTKTVDSQNYGDESRGKFYEKYMKKRNAKLQEDWSVNRSEKEARMRAMQESLDRSKAEMIAKFSGSISRQNSAGGSQRAERFGYNKPSIKREQVTVLLCCFCCYV